MKSVLKHEYTHCVCCSVAKIKGSSMVCSECDNIIKDRTYFRCYRCFTHSELRPFRAAQGIHNWFCSDCIDDLKLR